MGAGDGMDLRLASTLVYPREIGARKDRVTIDE